MKENAFEQINKDLENKLKKVRENHKEVEFIEKIPAGRLIEKIIWHNFRGMEPFMVINGKEINRGYITKELVIETQSGKRFNLSEVTKKLKSKIYFMRAKYNGWPDKEDYIFNNFALVKKPDFTVDEKELYKEFGRVIIYGDLSIPGNVLALLHEIGHCYKNKDKKFQRKYEKALEKLEQAYALAEEKNLTEAKKGEILYLPEGKTIKRPVPLDLYINFLKLELEDERGAWAFALETLDHYRKNGIDLEPELKTVEEINNFLESLINLGGYEQEFKRAYKELIREHMQNK